MSAGKSVWLYGDTMSGGVGCKGRFVHSSAITQVGSRLHVSRAGAQVLPNDTSRDIYWISEGYRIDATHLKIVAAPMHLGTGGVWDFKRRSAYDRIAVVSLSIYGDLTFQRWIGWKTPRLPFNDFKVIGPHHFTYENRRHYEFKLASGKYLWTVCQNWDDGVLHPFSAYRPIWYEK